jgi:hypothetical protein
MTKRKEDLPRSALPSPVCQLDPDQTLTRYQVLGLLQVSETTLDDWHRRKRPPPRHDYNGHPRYLAGEVCNFLRGVSSPSPEMRGGRRAKQSSFREFAATAQPTDTWPFLMLSEPRWPGPPHRPVDVVETLTMDGITDDDRLEYLTLLDYAGHMLSYQKAVAAHDGATALSKGADEEPDHEPRSGREHRG